MKIFLHGVFTVLMLFFVLTSCDKKKSNIQDVVQLIPTKKLEHTWQFIMGGLQV
jgi:hypothetical protein